MLGKPAYIIIIGLCHMIRLVSKYYIKRHGCNVFQVDWSDLTFFGGRRTAGRRQGASLRPAIDDEL